ncbi:MAG TPA: ATP-binding protein [Gemmatimonadaceae bacterium]|nr:ATP-binding protein [Gemmatimonadaceae bacterium]
MGPYARQSTAPPDAVAAPDFRAVFEAIPGAVLLLAADAPRFSVLAVSDAFVRATRRRPEQLVGRALEDAMPHPPTDPERRIARELHASLARVLAEGRAERMPVVRLDAARADGTWEERHWVAHNVPVRDAAGRVAWLLHAIEDITVEVRFRAELEAAAAAERAAGLQRVTSGLVTALTPQDVAEVVVREGGRALGAERGSVALLTADGAAVEVVAAIGYSAEAMATWGRAPLASAFPLADAIRGGEAVLLESGAQRDARYPHLVALRRENGDGAMAAVPFLLAGRTAGALGFNFAEVRHFTDGDRSFLTTLAQQCAQALERARLYEAERRARDEAQAAERRARFLAESSRVLGSSFDADEMLRSVARLAVPALGDWCIVDVLDLGERRVRRVARVHADPAKRPLLDEMAERYPPDPTRPTLGRDALQTGRVQLYAELSDAFLAAYARDARHAELVRAIGARSAIVAPLIARDRAYAVLALFSGTRHFDDADLALIEELARRVALAVDNARLLDEARRARDEAERARAEAEAANRAKSEFLAVMSHELRTPLNAIAGHVQLVEMGVHGPVSEAQRDALARVARSQRHLLRLINDVLNFARVETGHVEYDLSDVPAVELARDVLPMIEPQAAAKGLTLDVRIAPSGGPVARADREKGQQILLNLLSNAVKFTAPGGRITLETGAAGAPGDGAARVLLRVRDTGRGIPPEKLEHIFEPFVQVDTRLTRSVEGVGLGLAISRDLARGMGGEVTAESVVGEGSVFTLALPAA